MGAICSRPAAADVAQPSSQPVAANPQPSAKAAPEPVAVSKETAPNLVLTPKAAEPKTEAVEAPKPEQPTVISVTAAPSPKAAEPAPVPSPKAAEPVATTAVETAASAPVAAAAAAAAAAPAGPALPLALRKDERDSAAKKDENLARINEALGGQWSVEIENVAEMNDLIGQADSSYANRTFSCIYDGSLDGLAYNISRLEDIVKAELVQQASSKKIIFRTDASESRSGYHFSSIQNGSLVIVAKPEYMWTNFDQVGNDIESALNEKQLPAGELSLALRKDQIVALPKRDENIASLASTLGFDNSKLQIEIVDPVALQKAVDAEAGTGYENRAFSCIYDGQLTGLVENIKRIAADDLVKSELARRLNGKFRFAVDASLSDDKYHHVSIAADGTLEVKFLPKYAWTNFAQVGEELEKLL